MWEKKYSRKIKVVSILITASFVLLIAATLSKGGIMALNHKDYKTTEDIVEILTEDKKQYTVIPGDIYDEAGNSIVASTKTVDKTPCSYHKSYSHLLGNLSLDDDAYLNSHRNIILTESMAEKTPHKGYSIMLTINDELQQFVYSLTEGEQASAVVIRRHSGEVLALTSTYQQDFDLGSTIADEQLAAYNNSGEPVWTAEYLNAYPPGSCQKIFSAAVAFETGNGDYTIDDTGFINTGEDKIYNYRGTAYGANLGIEKAFTVSANTYFASLFTTVDISEIRRLSDSLLLNQSIKTDFGTVSNTFSFGDYNSFDIGLLGIGQKNALSAVGLAMLTQGVIDNEIFRPHVTKAVCYSDNDSTLQITEKTEEEQIAGDMLSDETCSQVRTLMETAANSYGMSDNVSGAKTGTAEIEINGTETGRANMVAYDENYIVVVSKSGSDFGISNKDIVEKLFHKLDDIG